MNPKITLLNGKAVTPDELIKYEGIKDLFAIVEGEAFLARTKLDGQGMYNGSIYYQRLNCSGDYLKVKLKEVEE